MTEVMEFQQRTNDIPTADESTVEWMNDTIAKNTPSIEKIDKMMTIITKIFLMRRVK